MGEQQIDLLEKENKPIGAFEEEEEEDFTKSVNDKSPNNNQHSARSDFKDNERKSNISHISNKTEKSQNKITADPQFGGNRSQKSIVSKIAPNENLVKDLSVLQPYLIHQTDRVVRPIIGNPEIEKLDEFAFYPELTSIFFCLIKKR